MCDRIYPIREQPRKSPSWIGLIVFHKINILKNLAKFTSEYLRTSLFLMNLQSCGLQLYWEATVAQVFSFEFCEIFWDIYFIEHLWVSIFKWGKIILKIAFSTRLCLYIILINIFDKSYFKSTSPDHIRRKY